MRTPDGRSLVALLLTSHLVSRAVKPLRSSEFWSLLDRVEDVEALMGQPPARVEALAGVAQDRALVIHELLQGAASFAFELEDLQRRGIEVLSALDERYPSTLRSELGPAAPPVLYAVGPVELLGSPGVGVVGARDVTPEASRVAQDAARALAANGLTVYSGAAKGIDQIAMNASLSAGGAVVGVLADALERRLRDPDTRRAILDERVCLCTPYKPSMGFTVANAMARNKVIYALARETFVVQSDLEKGGTWAGAAEWLRRAPRDVAVWVGAGRGNGNEALVQRGARPIERIEQLTEPHDDRVEEPLVEAEQLGFRV